MDKNKIPIKNKEDFDLITFQEKDLHYIGINGNLFTVEGKVFYGHERAEGYYLAISKNLKDEMENAKTALEYDTIFRDFTQTYLIKFRIH